MADQTKKYTLTGLFSFLFIAVTIFNISLLYFAQENKDATWLHFSVIAASLIFFLTALLIFLHLVASPLKKLAAACREIRKGNWNVDLEIKSKNEIGELIETFSEMVKNFKKSQTELRETRDILEIKVNARTKELQEIVSNQEEIIDKRTKELKERIEKLERFRRLTVGRELQMVKLKEEIKKVKNGNELPY